LADDSPPTVLELQIVRHVRGDVLNGQTQPAPGDVTLFLEIFEDVFGKIDGNGKADSLSLGDDGGIDAHDLAV